jgi:hypothetical protein
MSILAGLMIILLNIYQIISDNIPDTGYESITEITPIDTTGASILNLITDPFSPLGIVIVVIVLCFLYSRFSGESCKL